MSVGLSLLLAQPAPAPVPPDTPAFETEVQVEAAAPTSDDLAAFATELDPRPLLTRGQDLADLLRQAPGAQVFSYGGVGRYATVSLRGSTAEQVTVLVDGIPENRSLGGAVDLSFVPLAELQSVSVFRGFAPASSGVFGLGGLIDIRTRAPGADRTLDAALVVGELDFRRGVIRGGSSFGPHAHQAWTFERFESDGDFVYRDFSGTPLDPSDDRDQRRINNQFELDHLAWRGAWDRLWGGSLRVAASWRDRQAGVPGPNGRIARAAQFDQNRSGLSVNWGWRRPDFERGWRDLALLFDVGRGRDRLLDREGELGLALQAETTRTATGGMAAILRRSWSQQRLTIRVDFRQESARVENSELNPSDRGGLRRALSRLTLEDAWSGKKWTIAPALHFQHQSDRRLGAPPIAPPYDDSQRSRSEWSGKVGLARPLGTAWQWRSSVGKFDRIPSLEELFGDRGAVVGNPGLRAETGWTLESGLAWRRAGTSSWRWTGEGVVYQTRADELIQILPNSQGTAIARNLGASKIEGIEAALACTAPSGFDGRVNVTYQSARSDAGFTAGKPLAGRPRWAGSGAVAWRHAGWNAQWEVSYIGPSPYDRLDTAELRLPARLLHDVSLTRTVGLHWSVGLEVQNLFDRRTVDDARFPLPGRLFYASLRWAER